MDSCTGTIKKKHFVEATLPHYLLTRILLRLRQNYKDFVLHVLTSMGV
jgi:hypothetical protein